MQPFIEYIPVTADLRLCRHHLNEINDGTYTNGFSATYVKRDTLLNESSATQGHNCNQSSATQGPLHHIKGARQEATSSPSLAQWNATRGRPLKHRRATEDTSIFLWCESFLFILVTRKHEDIS